MPIAVDCSRERHTRLRHGSYDAKPNLRPVRATLLATSVAPLLLSGCVWTGFASLSDSGDQANQDSFEPSVSADGRYVAFQSSSNNLVPDDYNGVQDIFLRDLAAATIRRVSLSSPGEQGNAASFDAAVSEGGQYVAFASDATNLVDDDGNGFRDVFLRDQLNRTTWRLSAFGLFILTEGNGDSENPDISCSGSCSVVFESDASNLVSNDTNFTRDIFSFTIGTFEPERVSVDGSGGDPDGDSANPSVSAGGGLVAFDSSATDLLTFGSDTNGFRDVYVRNTALDENSLASVSWLGGLANGSSTNPDISADGRYVAFESQASNLIFSDSNTSTAIYVRDRLGLSNEKISVNDAGESANAASLSPSISGNGRYVAFWSNASNLVSGDTNNQRDIFVRDRWTNTTSRLSVDALGAQSNGLSDQVALSSDGRYAAFASAADNLVPDDDNDILIGPGFSRSAFDIVVRTVAGVAVTAIQPSVLPVGSTTAVTVTGENFFAGSLLNIGGEAETVSNLVVVDENTITADVAVAASAVAGLRSVTVSVPGTGAGLDKGSLGACVNCATYQ
mgnify:CR=1 FL=1|tara:strand:+ start:56223 stop:57911 length:1689 start_codon:yes stop_codon:yes gene_type:complete